MLRALPFTLALLLVGFVVWSVSQPDAPVPMADPGADSDVGDAALQGRALRSTASPAASDPTPAPAAHPAARAPTQAKESRRIQVRVVRGTLDGPPVEGIPIHRGETARPMSDPPADQPLGFTDFEGRVTVDVPAGIEIVHARPGPDYIDRAFGWVARRPEGPTIVLRPARRLTGRVLGVPADQMRTIYIQTRWTNPPSRVRDQATVGWALATKDGKFTVKVPADGLHVQLVAMPAGAWRPEAHGLKSYAGTFVSASNDGPFTLDFNDPLTISGEVFGDDGTKITHGTVSLQPLDHPPLMGTNAGLRNAGSNRFTLGGLAPGRYRLTAHSIQAGWASPVPRIITLPLKGELRVVHPPATSISGRVEGVSNPKGVHVEWWHRSGPKQPYDIQARTPLSANSTFALTNIADGDTLLRVIRAHTVLSDLTHVRVPAADVVVLVQTKKR